MSQERRRLDLEAKRQKLAELRARKAERERNAAAAQRDEVNSFRDAETHNVKSDLGS